MFIHKKPNEPKMIYLDQNKWIELSLAYYQNPRGMRFTSVLQQIQTAVKQNFARFPFSDTHIVESMKMGDISRRQRLAQVMAELSLGWSIAPKGNVTSQELGPALSVAFHEPVHLVSPHVFGQGVEFAFGQPLHVPEFLKSLNSPNEAKKKLSIQTLAVLLCAPDETLRKPAIDKYNTIANEIANSVDQIRNLVRNESRDLRHRAYMGRQLYDDLKDQSNELYIALSQLGYTFEDFLNLGKEKIKKFYDDVPTLDVFTKLKDHRHDQFNKSISANDVSDLTFLPVAIPYCDIVVTERQWVAFAKAEKFDQKYNTVIISNLEDLIHYIVPS